MKHVFTLTLRIDESVTNDEIGEVLSQVRTDLRCGTVSCLNEDKTFKHTNVDLTDDGHELRQH